MIWEDAYHVYVQRKGVNTRVWGAAVVNTIISIYS